MTAEDRPVIERCAQAMPPDDLLFRDGDVIEAVQVDESVAAIKGGDTTFYPLRLWETRSRAWAGSCDCGCPGRTTSRKSLCWWPPRSAAWASAAVDPRRVHDRAGQRVEKVVAEMMIDQDGAITLFGAVGFNREAVLHYALSLPPGAA